MWLSTLEIGAAQRSFAWSQKRHNHSFVWTEALSGMILEAAQKLKKGCELE